MSANCFWCSGMRHLGAFGQWFERNFKECCRSHDIDYIKNTTRRGNGLPPLKPRLDIDKRFMACVTGKSNRIIGIISYIAVRVFYWPNRLLQFLLGKVDYI